MANTSSNNVVTFTPDTRAEFLRYLLENPNNRRLSQTDKDLLMEWLTNPDKRPSSQEEFSRRNYVRKTFAWNEETQTLLAVAKKDEDKNRIVVTEDKIVDIVELVHNTNDHGGWDATWKGVSTSYYGILRSDVIFLLKQCQHCRENPLKRPKGSAATLLNIQPTDLQALELIDTGDIQYDNAMSNILENEIMENPARGFDQRTDFASGRE